MRESSKLLVIPGRRGGQFNTYEFTYCYSAEKQAITSSKVENGILNEMKRKLLIKRQPIIILLQLMRLLNSEV